MPAAASLSQGSALLMAIASEGAETVAGSSPAICDPPTASARPEVVVSSLDARSATCFLAAAAAISSAVKPLSVPFVLLVVVVAAV